MLVYQIVNAITMIAPLISLVKHRHKKGKLKSLMKVHIPISFIYHALCAFTSSPRTLILTLRSLDYFFIHLSGLCAAKDLVSNKNINLSYLLHAYVLYKCVKHNIDMPYLKCIAITIDTFDIFRHHFQKASQAFCIGIVSTCLYINDGKIPYGHAMFHVSLYWLFECYFDMLT